jgi:very-short-patch-repair endonuclease
VVELDGSQHRDSNYDRARDRYMVDHGWTVLRFWAWDMVGNLEGVLSALADAVVPPRPP